ncbi:MAG TPA: efflux RND transporter periplasmic adaptor subunit [Acetobacteraceae bacterium]|nr:efflux RND transporter periplasmic adaptor subunit [Acetobacteraceae bacterium]
MTRSSARRTMLAGLGVAVAAGLAVVVALTPSRAAPPAAPAPGIPVQVAKAAVADVPVMLANIGAVQADHSVVVRARVDGTLEQVLFHEGQDVAKGQLLAVIDPRPYAAVLAQAAAKQASDQAMLASAKKDLTRFSNLARDKFGTVQSVDQQTGTVGQLTATIEGDAATMAAARLNLEFTEIRAPLAGRVGFRQVDAGNLIHATDAQGIVTINQIHPIAVMFSLPQDDLPVVQAAMQAAAGGPSLPVRATTSDGKILLGQGRLLTIDNTVDATTGNFKLKATFANAHDKLWPGEFVHAQMQVGLLKGAVTVPSAAVQRGPDGLYVYVVGSDQRASRRTVKVRQDNGREAVIANGIAAGESVVVNGQSRLQQGSLVEAGA